MHTSKKQKKYARFKSLLIIQAIMGLFIIQNVQAQQEMMHCYLPDPNGRPREHNVDMEKMVLDVSFQPEKGLVMGTVTHYFKPIRKVVDSIWLDGVNMTYKGVKLDNVTAKYKSTPEGIMIYPAKSLTWETAHQISISYECTPKRGIFFIGWNDSTKRSRRQIWTQGEEVDNRNWIPAYDDPDDKLITEINATMEGKYKVLANGNAGKEKVNKDGSTTWHYKMTKPHTFYLVMMGIGDYAVRATKSGRGVPVYSWYYPDRPEQLEPTYRYTEQIMDTLEKYIGTPFPWESYAQIPVQDFLYGAMENTTATIFGDFFCVDNRAYLDRNYIGVNAHEMVHQWFGDDVSARSPRDQWLQESFATYYAKVAEWKLFNKDRYDWNRRSEQNTALGASKNDKNPIATTMAGGARIYQKGSFVLGMLNDVVGAEAYRKVIQHYLQRFAYQNVTTYDLMIAFHDVLGQNMDWFFDQWIYRGGEPEYNIHYDAIDKNGAKSTEISIEQVQPVNDLMGLFKMPITVQVFYKDHSSDSKTEWVEKQHHVISVPNAQGKAIDFVLFDPDNKILKQVKFEKGFDELCAQAMGAPNMLDRYDALLALKATPLKKKYNTLMYAYFKERYAPMKAEVLSQLTSDSSQSVEPVFNNAIHASDAALRLSAIQHIPRIKEAELKDYEALLTDSSYNVIETALNKLVALYPANKARYMALTDHVDGFTKNVRLAWIKLAAMDGNKEVMHELADYAGPSFEFRTRGAAFQVLMQLNYLDDVAIKNLFDAALSNNGRLSRPALDALSFFCKQSSHKQRIEHILNVSTDIVRKDNLSKLLKQNNIL